MVTKTTKNNKPRPKTLTGSSGIARNSFSNGGKLKKKVTKKKV